MKPKEDPQDRAARERERRITDVDRRQSSEKGATSLTTDLRAIYGLRNLPMFGTRGAGVAPKAKGVSGEMRSGSDR
jgi:hypothetical protein